MITLPLASSTATLGFEVKGAPAIESPGEVRKTSCVAVVPAWGTGRDWGSVTTKLKGELTTPDGDVMVIVTNLGRIHDREGG